MPNTNISFKETGFFSKLICDYLDKNESVHHLYGNFPDIEGLKNQIDLKKKSFSNESRVVLSDILKEQYAHVESSDYLIENIELLKESNTFTIVTGHQLNVFTGPLYFLYKIISTINLTKKLKEVFQDDNFVPVYWMATEDHDFEEINHFFVNDTKLEWDVESSGPVGRKSTDSLESVFESFDEVLGENKNATFLKQLFEKAYLEHQTLSGATRFLVNELFGTSGLVIIDGDNAELKKEFVPYVEKELLEQYAHKSIAETNTFLENNYKVQVNPREINLFYIEDNLRERIVLEKGVYKVNNTALQFSKEEITKELKNNPQKFSPNVIMRPLYQEVVLPNLCYIGGGGELAYWLQLKNMFLESEIPFPVLMLRNSVLFSSKKIATKLGKLNLRYDDLFLKQNVLIDQVVQACCQLDLSFSKQRKMLEEMFLELKPLVEKTDITFKGALEAQEKKQLKGLQSLEKRLLKAEKRKYADVVNRTILIQNELFPRKGLQERNINFSSLYKENGDRLIETLFEELDPLDFNFKIIEI